MNLDDEFDLEHLLFRERICTSCGKKKDLMNDFYLTRKNRKGLPSAYSYECKKCTIDRVKNTRKKLEKSIEWEYPDW
jgi:hypothetical protein|tara:strand:- start:2073 stop:2303 length:231 start_codon:yes stop_codon:yes gene_type:complete